MCSSFFGVAWTHTHSAGFVSCDLYCWFISLTYTSCNWRLGNRNEMAQIWSFIAKSGNYSNWRYLELGVSAKFRPPAATSYGSTVCLFVISCIYVDAVNSLNGLHGRGHTAKQRWRRTDTDWALPLFHCRHYSVASEDSKAQALPNNTFNLENNIQNVVVVIRCKFTVNLLAVLEELHFKKGEI